MNIARVLIVEDGNEYIESFSGYLGQEFEFTQARNAADAIALQCERPFHLIFLDMRFDRVTLDSLVGDMEQLTTRFNGDRSRAQRYLMDNQGLYILRALRDADVLVPVVLSYDFADESRRFAALSRNDPGLFYVPDLANASEIRAIFLRALGA